MTFLKFGYQLIPSPCLSFKAVWEDMKQNLFQLVQNIFQSTMLQGGILATCYVDHVSGNPFTLSVWPQTIIDRPVWLPIICSHECTKERQKGKRADSYVRVKGLCNLYRRKDSPEFRLSFKYIQCWFWSELKIWNKSSVWILGIVLFIIELFVRDVDASNHANIQNSIFYTNGHR